MRGLLANVSLESIDFQNGTLFKELTMAFEELKKAKTKDAIEGHEAITRASSIVKHHTGIKVVFDIGVYDPCVEIPAVNKNNVLVNSWIKNFLSSSDGLRMIEESQGAARGWVDLKNSKVGGIYSDVQNIIHLPTSMFLTSKFSPEEIAAITLHEIGHLFTYFEFMTRSVTTNQCLAGMSKALDKSGDVKTREAVFISVKKALKLNELDIEKLCQSPNGVCEVVILANVAKQSRQELGANIYDFNTWEYLSDQFAARHGAGRYLVTSLDKVMRGFLNKSFRSTPMFIAIEAMKAVMLAGVATGLFVVATGMLTSSAVGTWVLGSFRLSNLLAIMLTIDSDGDGTYDKPEARLRRIRNQIIEALKDKTLSKDDQQRLAEDIIVMDDIMKDIVDRRQLVGVLYDFLSPTARKNRTQELLQKDLEQIAANELFLRAAQLKQLA